MRAHPTPPEKASKEIWRSTNTQNLYLHVPSGNYYARLSVKGKQSFRSLRTQVYQRAKELLPAKLLLMGRRVAVAADSLQTFADVVVRLRATVKADAAIMDSTRTGYLDSLAALGKGAALPEKKLAEVQPADMVEWWNRVLSKYAPQQANHLLMWVRRGIELARSAGVISENPAAKIRRLRIVRKRRDVLTPEQFHSLISVIRDSSQWHAQTCADWLEFAAYSGMRPGEQLALKWEHINEDEGFIRVAGGKTLSQTGSERPPIPIIAPMRRLLKTLDREGVYVFPRKQHPRNTALRNACRKLGLPHQRVYDLRHMFATVAIKSGVDVPTVSRWLGHADGGALAMRTYVHPDHRHSLASAKKVKF
jgi:integrase